MFEGDKSLVHSIDFSNFPIVKQMVCCLDEDLQFHGESKKSVLHCFGCHTCREWHSKDHVQIQSS